MNSSSQAITPDGARKLQVRLLADARLALQSRSSELERAARVCGGKLTLFFSMCDGESRAVVLHFTRPDLSELWSVAEPILLKTAGRANKPWQWLRIDWIRAVQKPVPLCRLKQDWKQVKRNYLRCGLAFDSDFRVAFTEQELNANACLYGGNEVPHVQLNEKNFQHYSNSRFGPELKLPFQDESDVWVFETAGLFLSEAGLHAIDTSPRNEGRRILQDLNADSTRAVIDSASKFLASQVRSSGQFVYGHFPVFGHEIPTYNTLRHASSVYAMLEAWELNRDDELMNAIRRAIDYLLKECIRLHELPGVGKLAFNVETGANEIKLGASAVAILALVKYDQLTGDTQHRPLLEQLALGIAAMQNQHTGQFVHVLHADTLKLKEAFRIVYYDGEAAFALMRLYGLTKDPRWLFLVRKAFDYFMEAKHWKHHDHWLSYCVNELTLYTQDSRYFKFGVQNIFSYLDFIEKRETTFPTLLELCMAFEQMLRRIQATPTLKHLLDGFDVEHFYRAMHSRANHLMNGFFFPEVAMYFKKPASVLGSFFIRHQAFRVRIDDVEHYLSGLVAYQKYLLCQPSLPVKNIQLPTVLNGLKNGSLPADLLQRVRGGQLLTLVAQPWNSMRAAALKDGVVLLPVSEIDTYRPLAVQESLFKKRFLPCTPDTLGAIEWAGQFWALKNGEALAAVPGTSSHGWGIALDVRLDRHGRVKKWLLANASHYGFCWEHQSEPWHLVYFAGDSELPRKKESRWGAQHVAQATPGSWVIEPDKEWCAGGVAVWSGSHRPSDIAVLAHGENDRGMRPSHFADLPFKPAALLTSMPLQELEKYPWSKSVPVYQVQDNAQAIIDLGYFARQCFTGRVIGVTGTAGKTTTVQLLAHALGALGHEVPHSRGNGNLPFGVAWNLCQMDWSAPFSVLELAIGSMDLNTRMARPDVAIVTNIGPSHLEYHGNTRNVALKKSAIFRGVPDGGAAVICLDTEHADVLIKAAKVQQLRLFSYGEHPQASVRLLSWNPVTGLANLQTPNGEFDLQMPGLGKHMVLNAMACVATAIALGLSVPPLLKALGTFKPAGGRGELLSVIVDGRKVTVIDESYNANPVSMAASLQYLGVLFQQGVYKRKIMLLGDMLELGENTLDYHADLATVVTEQNPDLLLLCGPKMRHLAAQLPIQSTGRLISLEDAEAALNRLPDLLSDGDLVLVKSSHGTGLHKVVAALRRGSCV